MKLTRVTLGPFSSAQSVEKRDIFVKSYMGKVCYITDSGRLNLFYDYTVYVNSVLDSTPLYVVPATLQDEYTGYDEDSYGDGEYDDMLFSSDHII